MMFLRTLRLDETDTRVYETAATPGEWAVPGSFVFVDMDPTMLSGKRLQAFKGGFLGTQSFGWSTLVEIAEISDDEYLQVIDRLAAHFVECYGAPHIAAALPKAAEEAQYVADMCADQPHTMLAIERDFSEEGVVERLKVVRPNAAGHNHLKLWELVED